MFRNGDSITMIRARRECRDSEKLRVELSGER